MEWIRLTPNTQLPDGVVLLIGWQLQDEFYYDKALITKNDSGYNALQLSDTSWPDSDFTHYCIVKEPKDEPRYIAKRKYLSELLAHEKELAYLPMGIWDTVEQRYLTKEEIPHLMQEHERQNSN